MADLHFTNQTFNRGDVALSAVTDLEVTVDTKASTLWSDTQPSPLGRVEGDLWVNTLNGANTMFRFTNGLWVNVQDKAIGTAQGKADTAYNTADGKNAVFHQISTSPPSVAGLKNGDLWFQTDKDNAVQKWNSTLTRWDAATLGDGAIGNLNVGHLTTGILSAQVTLSGVIATAMSGPRVQLDSTGITAFKDNTTTPYFKLDKTSLTINGGDIRTAFPKNPVTNLPQAYWSLVTSQSGSQGIAGLAQSSNALWAFTGHEDPNWGSPGILAVNFQPDDTVGHTQGDYGTLGIAPPDIGGQGSPSITMYGQSRDGKGTSPPEIRYSADMINDGTGTPGNHTFVGSMSVDHDLTLSGALYGGSGKNLDWTYGGHIVIGDKTNNAQRIIYQRKQTDAGSHAYEVRTYLYGGQDVSGYSVVMYKDSVLATRMDLNEDGSLRTIPTAFGNGSYKYAVLSSGSASKQMSWGYQVVTTNSTGTATVSHDLVHAPGTVIAVHRSGTSGSPHLLVRPISGTYTATTFQVMARNADTNTAYVGNVGVEWFVGD